jgi:phospholipid transport system substrate-binding protein
MLPRIFFVLCFIYTASAFAATTDDVRQFVDGVGQRVIEVIDSKGKSDSQKEEELRQMFLDNVDLEWISNFALGSGLRNATPDQRNRYMKAYKKYMLAIYTQNFSEYTGSKYNITEVRDDGDGQFVVMMQIKTPKPNQPETDAGYRILADKNGKFRIIDIIVEGVSLMTTQRSEFGSVMRQSGMEGLIKAMENKAANAASGGKKKSS